MRATSSGRPAHVARAVLAAALLLAGGAGPSGAAGVVSASQVCADGVDPCKVTTVVPVEDGAALDFGTRAVQLSGNGQFNFGAGSARILCGPFSAATAGTAINAKGTGPEGNTESGSVTIEARRLCSGGEVAMPCIGDSECQLGSCSVRRCSGRPTRICTSDESCTIGPCGGNKRCANAADIVRCDKVASRSRAPISAPAPNSSPARARAPSRSSAPPTATATSAPARWERRRSRWAARSPATPNCPPW